MSAQLNDNSIYLISGKRTPFGSFGGSLKDISPVDLAVLATNSLKAELKFDPHSINQVILGSVIPSTSDALYGARHLALKTGCSIETPAHVVNRLCGSGIETILQAARIIRAGEGEAILAGGTENMSLTPHLLYGARFGTKYGAPLTVDLLQDALTDKYTQVPMAMTAETLATEYKLTREDCDRYAFESHQRGTEAYLKNLLQAEIAPFPLKKGALERDEHLRSDVSLDEMKKLRPVFKQDGVVTAANASGIVDGAAVVLVANGKYCKKFNFKPLAEIVTGAVVGVPPEIMGIGPVPAIRELMQKAGVGFKDIDLFEINEAFASQTLACQKELGIPMNKLNIWGGAIALGHPLAASGTRISLTMARMLREKKLKLGIASACIGGGQGIAILLRSV